MVAGGVVPLRMVKSHLNAETMDNPQPSILLHDERRSTMTSGVRMKVHRL